MSGSNITPRCDRWPDEIVADYDARCNGEKPELDSHEILWQIIDTVRDSYSLALRGCNTPLSVEQILEVETTVDDFLANAFGDD